MQTFAALVALSLNAILIENFIFSKFLGICPFLGVSKKTNTAVGMGLAVIFTMTLASALTYVVYRFILVPAELEYLKTIAFIIVIASLVQFIEMFLQKSLPALYSALGIYLPLITTNCAVLGVALLNITNEYNFLFSVVYGFMAGVGFLLAIVLLSLVRERIEYCDIPEPFRGFPIALIASGLLSIAFMGFSGFTLPF
ncbi:MAG: electron transport complex subunit RsxA [Eubacteriales bacterium]|nr:electron transport complex subunit RsxA [Clostridiales bacterium]MDD6340999.1 electron transport complex subunit RsxA [Eubacteriales bacterium]MDD7392883.1 electron transport complex subunit RsxA [Eubacteriales bacterium]MDY3760404.1 electron transport complex subunit RsxA [Eubacteriales bacterium]